MVGRRVEVLVVRCKPRVAVPLRWTSIRPLKNLLRCNVRQAQQCSTVDSVIPTGVFVGKGGVEVRVYGDGNVRAARNRPPFCEKAVKRLLCR